MAVAREPIHVDADLGHEDFRCALIDTGNGIEALHRVREGHQDRRDTLAQRGHGLFEMVEMGEDLGREKGVMGAEVAGERLPQGREFGPHAAPRQLGQDRGVARALHEGLQHGAARGAEDVPGHGRQLDAGIFEHLVDPVRFAGALLDERLPIAREIPELANGCWRHKAPPQKAMLQQLREPRTVLHVRLPARHLFNMRRVH